MISKSSNFFLFIIKTILLFCFIYEFRLTIAPSPLFSSRKIVFVLLLAYLLLKKYRMPVVFKEKEFKSLFKICGVCLTYSIIVYMLVGGSGTSIISWFVFTLMYSLIGVLLFTHLFDNNLDTILKSLALVTLFQAFWCISTFYVTGFRVLNDALFVIEENENIDFLTTGRVRSIGAAGASLSVLLSLSSYSFLYFISKGEKVLINSVLFIICAYATMLAGTTGLLIILVSVTCVVSLSLVNKRKGLIFALFVVFALFFFLSNTDKFMDSDKYYRVTYKIIDLFLNREESGTLQNLSNQIVPPVSFETVIGTGLSRGVSVTGIVCDHDGGYFRTYFGLGLIMTIIFYGVLFYTMYKMTNKIKNTPRQLFILSYWAVCIVIEYKEPFLFKYIPLFIFIIMCLKEREDTRGSNVLT